MTARVRTTEVPLQPGTRSRSTTTDPMAPLASYPHVAHCSDCQAYLSHWLPIHGGPNLVWATLAHHNSDHRHDPFTTASEHFSIMG